MITFIDTLVKLKTKHADIYDRKKKIIQEKEVTIKEEEKEKDFKTIK